MTAIFRAHFTVLRRHECNIYIVFIIVLCLTVSCGNKTGKKRSNVEKVRFFHAPRVIVNQGEYTEIPPKQLMRYSTRPKLWMLMRKIQKPRKNYTAVMTRKQWMPKLKRQNQGYKPKMLKLKQLNLNIYLSKLFCNMMLIVCFQHANHLETLFCRTCHVTIWRHNWWRHIGLEIKVWSCFNFCTV